ncbi:MAG: leucine-rich repeat protein [Lachnospiraceae bacterium]
MTERRYETAGAVYFYTNSESGATITGYEGTKMEVSIPPEIEGNAVCAIGKKAFFNRNGLFRIHVPETVRTIGDWAFAHCRDLEEIYLPRQEYELGRALFTECDSLKRICLTETGDSGHGKDENGETAKMDSVKGFGSLLAAVCGVLDAPYLFQTTERDNEEWLALWDTRMLTILHEDDMEGYTRLLLCGEEDYGSRENNPEFFLSEKRKRKVRLAFLRLLYDKGLATANKKELKNYLLSHSKGCESEETWQVLKEEHGEDIEYISLFLELGCLTMDNFDGILRDLGEEHPQMKAYFMRYREEKLGGYDFFEHLSLDL